MQTVALNLTAIGLSCLVAGALLLLRGRARCSATLLAVSGAGSIVTGVLFADGATAAEDALATAVVGIGMTLAVATYPVLRWRHPVDAGALVLLGGCGLTGTLWPAATESMGLVQWVVLFAYIWWRIEVSTGRERRAVQWLAVALGGTGLMAGLLTFATEEYLFPGVFGLLFAAVPPALYVGATLPELVDVRGLFVSAVVLAVTVICFVAAFTIVVGLLEAVGAEDPNVGALGLVAALVAIGFQPLRVVLRGVVDEVLFGARPDPIGAASAVAGAIGDEPSAALDAIRGAMALPYAALSIDGTLVATSGEQITQTRSRDLPDAGTLVVGLRPGDLRFSAEDEQVLALIVPLLTQTVRAQAMAEEVRESRSATVAAVEEERRRLRRDLHDGLGPRLSGVAFTSDAARNLIRTDPDRAEEMVDRLRADTVTAIEEIRRMVYAMRPPALDELGLVPALRQHARGLCNRSGTRVQVEIAAPDELPDLPAAVEVATYRIVTEALTNTARHTDATRASVRLDVDQHALHLEVTDAGPRVNGSWRPGVGISSMRERAAELGGSLEAGPGAEGARVAARLPL